MGISEASRKLRGLLKNDTNIFVIGILSSNSKSFKENPELFDR